jgi:hypothetical protein
LSLKKDDGGTISQIKVGKQNNQSNRACKEFILILLAWYSSCSTVPATPPNLIYHILLVVLLSSLENPRDLDDGMHHSCSSWTVHEPCTVQYSTGST